MPVKNNFAFGALLGSILPLLAYFLAEVIFKDQITPAKPGVLYLIAIAANLFLARFSFKSEADKTATAILIITFLVLVLTFIFKIKLR